MTLSNYCPAIMYYVFKSQTQRVRQKNYSGELLFGEGFRMLVCWKKDETNLQQGLQTDFCCSLTVCHLVSQNHPFFSLFFCFIQLKVCFNFSINYRRQTDDKNDNGPVIQQTDQISVVPSQFAILFLKIIHFFHFFSVSFN